MKAKKTTKLDDLLWCAICGIVDKPGKPDICAECLCCSKHEQCAGPLRPNEENKNMKPRKIGRAYKVKATKKQIEMARDFYQTNEVEIDDNALQSRADLDCGQWVSAWVWVSDEDLK
jgi:hypothetical protein